MYTPTYLGVEGLREGVPLDGPCSKVGFRGLSNLSVSSPYFWESSGPSTGLEVSDGNLGYYLHMLGRFKMVDHLQPSKFLESPPLQLQSHDDPRDGPLGVPLSSPDTKIEDWRTDLKTGDGCRSKLWC